MHFKVATIATESCTLHSTHVCMFYIFANAHTTRTTLYTFDGCETQFDLQSEWMFKYLSAKNNTHQIG